MAVKLVAALLKLVLVYTAWAFADAGECGVAFCPDVHDDEFSLLHTHAHIAVRGFGRHQSGESDDSQHVHNVEEHQLPTPVWVEQVLALFPLSGLNERARASIRKLNLIPQLEQFMRYWGEWDGYNETDHLTFWRAQQPLAHTWQLPQYVGQPNRFDWSRLQMNRGRDRWFQVIRRDLFFDDSPAGLPPPKLLMELGQFFNVNQRLEVFGDNLVPISWGPAYTLNTSELVALESIPPDPFKPYDAARDLIDQNMQSYIVTQATAPPQSREVSPHRSYTLLEGPGYQVKFMNVWNYDEAGNAVIQRSDTSCEVMLSEEQSRGIDRLVGNATCFSLLYQDVNTSIGFIDPYGTDFVDRDQLHGIFYGISRASNMSLETTMSNFDDFSYNGPWGVQYKNLTGVMLRARGLCMPNSNISQGRLPPL